MHPTTTDDTADSEPHEFPITILNGWDATMDAILAIEREHMITDGFTAHREAVISFCCAAMAAEQVAMFEGLRGVTVGGVLVVGLTNALSWHDGLLSLDIRYAHRSASRTEISGWLEYIRQRVKKGNPVGPYLVQTPIWGLNTHGHGRTPSIGIAQEAASEGRMRSRAVDDVPDAE